MSEFYLFMEQEGEGCDYTIGCGKKLLPLKATSREGAIKEVDVFFKTDGSYYVRRDSESSIYEALILEFVEKVDVELFKRTFEEKQKNEKMLEKEMAERELLQKLKAKYE